ncbi:MAG: tetratricopeptide repeat protein [Verrucomicrobiota bacterium]
MIAFLSSGAFDALCWLIVLPVLGVLGYRKLEQSDDRPKLIVKWSVSAALLVLMRWMIADRYGGPFLVLRILIPAVILAALWAPTMGRLLTKPLTDSITGGDEEVELKPFYYAAEGKRRQGLFDEAIAEVRGQLERFPGDAAGYMMLATIQAEDKHDVRAAEATLEELLAQPGLKPHAAVSALHALADWQLQFGRDTAAARAALERVVKLFPDSQFAHAAEQRLAHLGGVDETRRQRENAKFEVQTSLRKIGLEKGGPTEPAKVDADALAAECVKQLEQYPADTEVREKLAILYAEHFQRLDLAAAQLEQMIALPEETPKHVARWLNLLATFHIRCAKDRPGAEQALRRIIERFPKTAMAEVAATRLGLLPLELKAGQPTPPKRMGTYEKDLGLKKPKI